MRADRNLAAGQNATRTTTGRSGRVLRAALATPPDWVALFFFWYETRGDRCFIAAIESEFSISRMTVDTERPRPARSVIFQGLIAERECRDIATGGATAPRRVRTERVGIV